MNQLATDIDNSQPMYYLVGLLMLLTPLLWGIDRQSTLFLLEILCLPLIWLSGKHLRHLYRQYPGPLLLILLIITVIVLQLVPLPMSIWGLLPGREFYLEVFSLLPDEIASSWRASTIVPVKTEQALLYLLPPFAIFLAVLLLEANAIRKLVMLAIAMAIFQSTLGLVQYGGGIELPIDTQYKQVARGTYLNRDHLAGFLLMVFPVVLALLASMIGWRVGFMHTGNGMRKRWQFMATLQGNQAMFYGAIAILIMLCVIFTRSRAGIALLMIGLLFVLFAFSRRLGRSNIYGTYGTVVAIIVVLSIEIGLAPVLERFAVDPMQDLRWEIYDISLRLIGDYFPLGSGMGTFSSVYMVYQTPDLDGFINHAHNEYLQWLVEGGLPMLVIIAYGLYRYAIQWRVLWIKGQWGGFRFIQAGAGIGLLLVMVHSFLDFGLHKPANAIYFAFFMAIFFRHNQREMVHSENH